MRALWIRLAVWSILVGLVVSSTAAEETTPTTISWVQQQQEDEGVCFFDHGEQKDIFAILKDHGFNWIRLAHDADVHAALGIVNLGVEGLITGNITPDAASALKAGNVTVYKQTWGTVRDGIERFTVGAANRRK